MKRQDPPSAPGGLPVPAQALVPAEAEPEAGRAAREPGASVAEAHILSQAERRRGLRSGRQQVEAAASAYCEREWSGDADRRRPVGGAARRKV